MKSLALFGSIVAALFLVLSCGYQTAPIPYSSTEDSLPVASIGKPLFQGDSLVVNWNVNPATVDATADIFLLKVYKVQNQCRYCRKKILDNLAMRATPDEFSDLLQKKGLKKKLALYQQQTRYRLVIRQSVYKQWEKQGFYEISVQYKTEKGELAQESDSVAPVRSDHIPTPEWTIKKQETIESTGHVLIILQWKKVPEYVYRSINTDTIGNEKVQYYGLNLYLLTKSEEALSLVKWNRKPLRGSKIELIVANAALFACFVDRYKNESEKILILDNRTEEIEDENQTRYDEKQNKEN